MITTNKKVKQLIDEGVLYPPMDGNHGEKHPKTTDYVEQGIPFILVPDLVDGNVDLDNCNFISEAQANTLRKGFSKTGDVLFTHKATIGKVALVDTKDYEYIILTPQVTYYRIKNANVLNNEYLYYYFQSQTFQDTFRLYASSGGTRDYLGIVAQQKLPIIYPDIKIQKNIVNILHNYDALIRNNKKRIKILEQMADNLFKEWFVRLRFPGHETVEFEGGIPRTWKNRTIDEWLSESFNGGWGEEEPIGKKSHCASVIRGTDIEDIKASTLNGVPIRFHSEKEATQKALKEHDIILELSNGNINNIGRTLYVDSLLLNHFENVMCASFCKTLRFKNEFEAIYIWLYIQYLQNSGLMNYYKNTGANGINNFNFKRFLKIKISMPDANLIKPFMQLYREMGLLREKNINIKKQRDLLLPRLMSGKLQVK